MRYRSSSVAQRMPVNVQRSAPSVSVHASATGSTPSDRSTLRRSTREERPDSDVDLLVELDHGYDVFAQRLPLAERLSELLGRRVDLVPEHELNRHLRERILQEAIPLWAKPGSPTRPCIRTLLSETEK